MGKYSFVITSQFLLRYSATYITWQKLSRIYPKRTVYNESLFTYLLDIYLLRKYTNLKDTAGQSASAWSAVCTVCKRWDNNFQFEITRFESRRKAHKKGTWFKVFDVFSMVVCHWLNNKRMHKKRSPVWWRSPRFYASRVDYCEPWIFALWPSCNDIDEDFRGTDTDVMVMMKRNTMMMASMIVLIYRYVLYMTWVSFFRTDYNLSYYLWIK